MTTKTLTRTGVASWKKLLGEAESLRGQSGLMAYRRARIVTELYEDSDFRLEHLLSSDDAVDEALDGLVEDLCLTAAQLRTMLSEFPDESAWADGKLRSLYEQVEERLAHRRSGEDRPVVTRRRVTLKEFEELEKEKRDLEIRLRFLESEIVKLRQENERLKLENSELRGRLNEVRVVLRSEKAA
jgi:chromosome segregation ATPase